MKRTAGAVIVVLLFVLPKARDLQRVGGSSPATPVLVAASGTTSRSLQVPPSYTRNPLRFLSEAPADSLTLLPGIGPVLAERVARARNGKSLFTQWDDLLGVKGIGPRTVERLKALAEE